jgi:hypothetical protein
MVQDDTLESHTDLNTVSLIEIKYVKWDDENTFNDYIHEMFTVDHFDIGFNEIKMKHLHELKKMLIDELNNIVKLKVTKKYTLQRLNSLRIKHREQLIIYLTLSEINRNDQYIESHTTIKMLRFLRYELVDVDLEFKNHLVISYNLSTLYLEEKLIKDDLQNAIDFWNSGETMEY